MLAGPAMNKLIKIYGERNTNTNYMEKLIDLNLDAEQVPGVVPHYIKTIQKITPGKNWLRDLYFSWSYQKNLGWKHSRVNTARELKALDIDERDICFLSITKNPYSWLLSLHRKPYNQQYRGARPDFETFLKTPWKTEPRDNCEREFKNPIALWNIKNASYLQLLDLNGLNLTTESIIQDPESIIDRISRRFTIGRPASNFLNYEQSTKDSSKNFAYYQDYYLNEKWRDELSEVAVAMINETLDLSLMKHFGYKVINTS